MFTVYEVVFLCSVLTYSVAIYRNRSIVMVMVPVVFELEKLKLHRNY